MSQGLERQAADQPDEFPRHRRQALHKRPRLHDPAAGRVVLDLGGHAAGRL